MDRNELLALIEAEVASRVQAELFAINLRLDEISDTMPLTQMSLAAQFHRYQQVAEALVVEEYRLPSAQSLYLEREPGQLTGDASRVYLKDYESLADRSRVALYVLYYLLLANSAYAQPQLLKSIYGFGHTKWFGQMLKVDGHYGQRSARHRVERKFLDAIGKPDAPVTLIEFGDMRRIANRKRTLLGAVPSTRHR